MDNDNDSNNKWMGDRLWFMIEKIPAFSRSWTLDR